MIISSGSSCLANALWVVKNVRTLSESVLVFHGLALLTVCWARWEMIPVLVQHLETHICFSPDFRKFSVKQWLNFNGLGIYIIMKNTHLSGRMDSKAEDERTLCLRIIVTVEEISQNSGPDDVNPHSCSLKAPPNISHGSVNQTARTRNWVFYDLTHDHLVTSARFSNTIEPAWKKWHTSRTIILVNQIGHHKGQWHVYS